MRKLIKNNKGMVLIVVLGLVSILLVLSSAFVVNGIQERNLTQRYNDSISTLYEAEKGIEYAFEEARNHTWSWRTHQVDTTDSDGDGDTTELIRNPTTPTVTLNQTDPNPQLRPYIDGGSGNYIVPIRRSPAEIARIEVRSYADPNKPEETIVLSRNITGSSSRIIKFRISRRSLYKYFFYYPTSKSWFGGTFDGKGVGGIYVNGDIGLSWPTLKDITELSTNKNGIIYISSNQYMPPYQLDDKIGARDGKAPLPSLDPGHIYSTTNPYPWQSGNWPPSNWPPYDWRKVDSHFSSAGKVNSIDLPRTLSTSWNWDKYSGTDKSGVTEPSVQFFDSSGAVATAAYWSSLQTTYGASYFDPAFWTNKTYERTSETSSVNYLHTGNQSANWQNWIGWPNDPTAPGYPLKGVVQEKSTGGYNTAILNIQANYSDLAKTNGLYIGKDVSGSLDVWVNGTETDTLPPWITDNVQFFNTVRPKVVSGSPTKENVLQLDIQASLSSTQIPNNGIIYVGHKNLRLVKGTKLPKSLTVVSPYNIYIKGNYNTHADWKPAAVISNSLVYTLSNDFVDRNDLPATIYPREYPYELQYVNLTNFVPGDADKLQTLEQECEDFFGLNNGFEISATGQQPANLDALQTKIRQKHNTDYTNNMPNRVNSDTTMKVAITSPYEPTGYQLERWYRESWSSATYYSRQLRIEGAFIKLGSSWSASKDVPSDYWKKRTGIANLAGFDPNPMQHGLYLTCGVTPYLEYEEQFAIPGGRPSGDFFAGSQSSWQETSDFDHHTG